MESGTAVAPAALAAGELIGLGYSPFTEKARWALDLAQVPYRYSEHLLMFGDPLLRWKTKRWRGDFTVPVFIPRGLPGQALFDSFEIARFAARFAVATNPAVGAKLFPVPKNHDIQRFNDASERFLAAGRVVICSRVSRDGPAKREALPGPLPQAVRFMAQPLADIGLSYLAREFRFSTDHARARLEDMKGMLLDLRQALQEAHGTYLLGEFTFADIAMAVALQMVSPVNDRFMALKPATRRCWHQQELAHDFQDLLKWRDGLYERHRNSSL